MKYKSEYDIGEPVKIIFGKDVVEALKIMSKETWLKYYPPLFLELLNDNFDLSVKAVKYTPNIYFCLSDKFKNDKFMIKVAIKSFKKHNRLNEINIRYKPLKKRMNINE